MLGMSWFGFVLVLALDAYGQTVAVPVYSTTVQVPALVEVRSGDIAYGLSADDFSIKDDGIEQKVGLQSSDIMRPFSLILLIQTGHNAASQLGKISSLDNLLDSILTSRRDQVAIITFDSRARVLHDFASGSQAISSSFESITPGDAGSALFDAVHLAITSLRTAPLGNRKVILLISSEHDHGSNVSDTGSLIRDVSSSDASIYSFSFRADRKELLGKLWSLNPLAMTASEMRKNAPEALAQLTGGEFFRFDSQKNFEDHVSDAANHLHNRYSLFFQPNDPGPGFHSLRVEVRTSKVNVVSARTGYWLPSASNSGIGGGAQ
jgi:VWFA-related protein